MPEFAVFKKEKQCQQMRANFFMNAQIVRKYCVQNLVIVVFIVRMVQCVAQVNSKTMCIAVKLVLRPEPVAQADVEAARRIYSFLYL